MDKVFCTHLSVSKKKMTCIIHYCCNIDLPPCSNVIDAIVFNPEVVENSRTILVSPESYGLPFEVVHIDSKDGTHLMGYLLLQQFVSHSTVPTIIFYHGNSGNIGDRYH